jgi:hypothetical protein
MSLRTRDILFVVAKKTGSRSSGELRSPSRTVVSLALLLAASGVRRARAEEAGAAPAVADPANATDAAPPTPAPAMAPSAARVAARAVRHPAAPRCPSPASSAVAALDFQPRGRTVGVWFVPFAASSEVTRAATLPRRPDSPVAAVTVPGTDQVAVSVVRRVDRDPTWSASLFLAGPGRKARVLLERVFAGGPLLATPDGHLVVVRGSAGPERASSAAGAGFRRDSLEVVTIDPARDDDSLRVISRQTGDALFLVGLKGNDLFAYRVGGRDMKASTERQPPVPSGGVPTGELISIDLGTGSVRVVVAAMPSLARDFSLDSVSGMIWFSALRPAGDDDGVPRRSAATKEPTARYALYGLDVATARLSVVVTGDSLGFLPQAWPGDRVAFRCQDGSNALCLADRPGGDGRDGADARVDHLIANASAPAEVHLVSCSDAGEVVFGVRRDPGRSFPTPFLWKVGESAAREVALPAGQVRFVGVVDLAGVAGAATLPPLAPPVR